VKLWRDESGESLGGRLSKYGYQVVRTTGSHIRLSTNKNGEHFITIPKHDHLKIGTLNSILRDVADHIGVSKNELIESLSQE